MAKVIFLMGVAGTGKTAIAKKWVKSRLRRGEPWALLDKDTVGGLFSPELLKLLNVDPMDRDSPVFKARVRDLEYDTTLKLIKENLALGVNVIAPAPWTKELKNGVLFSVEKLGFPIGTKIYNFYIDLPIGKVKSRIINRDNPRDKWKLENWDEFSKSLSMDIEFLVKNRVYIINGEQSLPKQVQYLGEKFDA